ncbi:MAG: GIY-YIG nuclease family protein [Nitrospinae bacterium]|nr:GIY-YIG nuclease family protein [Nitrospinota bacterium]
MNNWSVYLLRCADGSLYCGVTNDLKKRLKTHNAGKASKFTRGRLPVKLAAVSGGLSKSEAMRHEYRIKRLPKSEKRRAVRSA